MNEELEAVIHGKKLKSFIPLILNSLRHSKGRIIQYNHMERSQKEKSIKPINEAMICLREIYLNEITNKTKGKTKL